MTSPTNPVSWMLRVLIKAYQWLVSPIFAGTCRYTPTCSSYALQAIDHHGPIKGTILSLKRILRCHPWHDGGYDPVPLSGHMKKSNHKTHDSCQHL